VAVRVAEVTRTSLPLSFPATGTVEALSAIPLRARVDGEVTKVFVDDGADVKQGDPILEIDARIIDAEIAGQQALVDRDRASLAKASRDVERINGLVGSNVQSRVTAADAETTRALAQAALDANEARLDELKTTRTHYTLRAPQDGRIGKLNARPGTWLKQSDTFIATLVNFDPVYVAVGIPQNRIADTADAVARQTARFEVSVPGRDEILTGKASVIENTADADTGLITLRALIANKGPRLWPGQVTDVTVVLRDEADVIAVPMQAVQTTQDGTYVFVIENAAASRRAVTVARASGGLAVISDGLKPGERVVTDGQLQLTDDAKVNVLP
jgi:RND family efflux transporter MFP subunit